jgi:hypothetical protein
LTVTGIGFPASELALLLRRCGARFLQCRPVRRVFECLIVLRQRVSRLALLGKHVAPCFQRIGPVRLTLIRVIELRLGSGEVTVASERDAPGVLTRRQIWRESDSFGICLADCPALISSEFNTAFTDSRSRGAFRPAVYGSQLNGQMTENGPIGDLRLNGWNPGPRASMRDPYSVPNREVESCNTWGQLSQT